MLTTNRTNHTKAARPSVIFGSYSQNLVSGANTASLRALVPEIVDVLWTNQRLADAFLSDKKGWQKELAKAVDLSPPMLAQAIKAFGVGEFKELVTNNPAGAAPMAVRPVTEMMPSMTYYGCENQTYGCDSPSSRCGTNSTCGTCGCGTAGCNTASCQSSACGTSICIGAKKHTPQPA